MRGERGQDRNRAVSYTHLDLLYTGRNPSVFIPEKTCASGGRIFCTGPDFGRGIPVPSYARSYGGNADHYDVWLDERFRGNTYVSLQRTKREGE